MDLNTDLLTQKNIVKSTKLLHGKWYLETYPDVAELGMDPLVHYLRYGARMGRNPGKTFDTKFYLKTYPEAEESGLNPLVYYWLHGREKGHLRRPQKSARPVAIASTNLFSLGFTDEPLAELELISLGSSCQDERAEAAREIALWHVRSRTAESDIIALDYVRRGQACASNLKLCQQLAVIEVVCLYRLGEHGAAREALNRSLVEGLATPDLRLAAANICVNERDKLSTINHALDYYSLPHLGFIDDASLSLYDRLSVKCSNAPVLDGPKISVLLAAYEAQDTLATALKSLQNQTWKNFEVLVLDDCSPTDGTRIVTESFSKSDSRVKYVRLDNNAGAYIARNHGLDLAAGEIITIHDADDWSHPLKLETQARFLLSNSDVLGCTSEQARCTSDLVFTKLRGGGGFTTFNTSSFMWKVDPVRKALGYWDTVRFGADNEFIRRMRTVFGKDSFVKMSTGPLSFQREADTSITGDAIKGIDIGGYYGVRKEYLLAQEYYHQREGADHLYKNDPLCRPFPAPEMMNVSGSQAHPIELDLVIYGDFRLGSKELSRALEVVGREEKGTKIGLVEAPEYDPGNGKLEWDPRVRDLIDGDDVMVLVFGDEAICDRELWLNPESRNLERRLMPTVQLGGPTASAAVSAISEISEPNDKMDIDQVVTKYRGESSAARAGLLRQVEALLKEGRRDSASRLLAELPPDHQPERLVKRCYPTDASFSLSRSLVERGILASNYRLLFDDVLPEWEINTKTAGNQFVKNLGYDVPLVIAKGVALQQVKFEPRSVVKPSAGGNSQGVFSIDENGAIFDVGANEIVDRETAFSRANAHNAKAGINGVKWNVEERISGPSGLNPVDLKFYAFYGKIGVVTEVQRQPFKAFNNYLRDGAKVSTGKYDGMTFDGTPPTEEEYAVAEAISRALPVPYLRIDFMRADDGRLLFCEFTPRPGNFDKHNRMIDQLCGRMYVDAECRILRDLLRSRELGESEKKMRLVASR